LALKQQSFSSLEQSHKKKRTKREIFLGEMDVVVPWARLEALIAPHYTKPRKGRPQMPLVVMLRIYFLQQWYGLSDPGVEEALYDMHSMRDFTGLNLAHDAIPDETTILNFRHLLEAHNLTEAVFGAVSEYLEEQSLLMRGGTIMDATLIAASPSTKNKSAKRDPDMSQTKKGNQWYFGMKAHIGVDAKSGLVHTVKTTTAKVHDARMTDDLIRSDDAVIFGDKGYVSDKRKRVARADGVLWAVKDKRKRGRTLSSSQKKRNRKHGTVRAKVEHIFRVIKCQFGYRKARYRGLAKNAAQMFSLMALANLYLVRQCLRTESV
jgi:IS5 family transposase